jgi:hypothetical protein
MQKCARSLWVVGLFGWFATANAQTRLPSTGTAFDGTYAFVSATKVNETYTTRVTNHILQCPERKAAGPLTIVNSHAHLLLYEGTVGSHGELAMRNTPEPIKFGTTPGVEITISGRIEGDGTVRARQIANSCSYDLVWRKEAR